MTSFSVEIDCQAEQELFGQFENFFCSYYQKIDINACYYYTSKPLRSSVESLFIGSIFFLFCFVFTFAEKNTNQLRVFRNIIGFNDRIMPSICPSCNSILNACFQVCLPLNLFVSLHSFLSSTSYIIHRHDLLLRHIKQDPSFKISNNFFM